MKPTKLDLLVVCVMLAFASGQNFTFTYKTVGDQKLELDVYVPSESKFRKYPVFFGMHQGGYITGNRTVGLSNLETNLVLSLGFVYVTIDYRHNPAVFLSDIIEDVQDAYNWARTELVKHVSIDINNIVTCGRSAGGGLALMTGYMLSPRPKAIIAFYPYSSNWTDVYMYDPETPVDPSLIETANCFKSPTCSGNIWDFLDKVLHFSKGGWILVSDDPNESPSQIITKLKKYSAVNFVDENYPPTYLIHGTSDRAVPYNQSVMMANALKAHNIKYKLDLIPGGVHMFDQYDSSIWKEHVVPVFTFAEQIVRNQSRRDTDEKARDLLIILWVFLPVAVIVGFFFVWRYKVRSKAYNVFSNSGLEKEKTEEEGVREDFESPE